MTISRKFAGANQASQADKFRHAHNKSLAFPQCVGFLYSGALVIV